MKMRLYTVAPPLAGMVLSLLRPVVPYAAVCSFLVVLDVITAINLRRRMIRRGMLDPSAGYIVSGKLGVAVTTLVKTYVGLLTAHGIDATFGSGSACINFVGGFVCFRQALSILENESSATDSTWARHAKRLLIDKANRHFV